MEAHPQGCLFTCRTQTHLTVHQKAVHGPFPEGSKTAKKQSKNLQEQGTKNVAPGVGVAKSGTKSAPSSEAPVEINAPLPKLTIKRKLARNTQA